MFLVDVVLAKERAKNNLIFLRTNFVFYSLLQFVNMYVEENK